MLNVGESLQGFGGSSDPPKGFGKIVIPSVLGSKSQLGLESNKVTRDFCSDRFVSEFK